MITNMSQDKIQYALKALLLEEAGATYALTGNDLIDELVKALQPNLLESAAKAQQTQRVIAELLFGQRRGSSPEAKKLLNEQLLTALLGLKQLLQIGNMTVVQATLTWHKFKTKEFIEAYIADEQE